MNSANDLFHFLKTRGNSTRNGPDGWRLMFRHLAYLLLRQAFRLALKSYYREIEVDGVTHIPGDEALLLVANHPNAMLDPLVVALPLSRRVDITAKSTFARRPVYNFFIRLGEVILLHRKVDAESGVEIVKNITVLRECMERLVAGRAICMFPEGESHSESRMWEFKHGASYLAVSYARSFGEKRPLVVVPVGLIYESKANFRSRVWIRYGKPIRVRASGLARGQIRRITELLQKEVKGLLSEAGTTKELEQSAALASLMTTSSMPLSWRQASRVRPRISDKAETQIRITKWFGSETFGGVSLGALMENIDEYMSRTARLGIDPELYSAIRLREGGWRYLAINMAAATVGLPLLAVVAALFAPTLLVVYLLAVRYTKDPEDWSANVIFAALLTVPLNFVLIVALSIGFFGPMIAVAAGVGLIMATKLSLLVWDRASELYKSCLLFTRVSADDAKKLQQNASTARELASRLLPR